MNYQKISEGLTFLMSDKRITIVHGVLKSLGISPRRDDYDDFVQDASIIFAQAYADFLPEKDEVENIAPGLFFIHLLDLFPIQAFP